MGLAIPQKFEEQLIVQPEYIPRPSTIPVLEGEQRPCITHSGWAGVSGAEAEFMDYYSNRVPHPSV